MDYDDLLSDVFSSLCQHNQDIIRQYLRSKQLAGLSHETIKNYQMILRHIIRYFGDTHYDELTAEQIEDFYLYLKTEPSKLTGKQRSNGSINHIIIVARQLVTSAVGKEKSAKLFERIKLKSAKQVTVREEELLTDAEMKRMISACKSERDRAIITTLYASGCRVGELVRLRIKDVQIDRISASLHLNGKTGERDVDMFIGVPELKSWLNVHPYRDDPEAPVFGHMRGTVYRPITPDAIEIMLNRRAREAGIPEGKRYHPHAFRHKRATDLADHLTIADLKQMFGWTDMSNTPSIYVHSSRRKVKSKLAEIAGVRVPETVVPSQMVRQCPVCGCVNAANDKWCSNCHAVLDEALARVEKRVEQYMLEHINEI